MHTLVKQWQVIADNSPRSFRMGGKAVDASNGAVCSRLSLGE